jgi:hypothetical protein
MPPNSAGAGIDRRQFLRLSAGSAAALSLLAATSQLSGCTAAAPQAAPGYQFLTLDDLQLFTALLPAINGPALPADNAELHVATLQRLDLACAGLGAPAQAELRKLLGLLHWAPLRRLAAGIRTSWAQASTADAEAFLRRWHNSRLELFNAGYRALTKLGSLAWWSQPASHAAAHYPGPPAWAVSALNS